LLFLQLLGFRWWRSIQIPPVFSRSTRSSHVWYVDLVVSPQG
jgi:hypothetical protein